MLDLLPPDAGPARQWDAVRRELHPAGSAASHLHRGALRDEFHRDLLGDAAAARGPRDPRLVRNVSVGRLAALLTRRRSGTNRLSARCHGGLPESRERAVVGARSSEITRSVSRYVDELERLKGDARVPFPASR
jgi:hypothetical protein